MSSSQPRGRFKGDVSDLAKVLAVHFDVPNCLGYAESMSAQKQPAKLRRKSAMFKELAILMPKLTFSQLLLKQALLEVKDMDEVKAKWQRELNQEQADTWSTALAKQLRTACRHINQSRTTTWCKALLAAEPEDDQSSSWHRDWRVEKAAEEQDDDGTHEEGEEEDQDEPDGTVEIEDGEGDDGKEEKKAPALDEHAPAVEEKPPSKRLRLGSKTDGLFVGWDVEMRNAYKCCKTSGANKEYAVKMECETDKQFPTAVFDDGGRHEVAMISCEEFKLLTRSRGNSQLWEGTIDGNRVTVQLKKDHNLLTVIYQNAPKKKMLCMVSVKAFGDEGPDHEANVLDIPGRTALTSLGSKLGFDEVSVTHRHTGRSPGGPRSLRSADESPML